MAIGRPPASLAALSGGVEDFDKIGADFVDFFIHLARLKPSDSVLDLGCGPGRIALPLLTYLTTGSYDGLDVERDAIRWCQEHITGHDRRFRFEHLDVQNGAYNPTGAGDPARAVFPYPDASFDFVCAISLFTHLLPPAYRNYLREARRVLKPGGTLFATYFLITPDSWRLMKTPYANHLINKAAGDCYVENLSEPQSAVGYSEDYVIEAHQRAGLEIERIFEGCWCGRRYRLHYQDFVISRAGEPSEEPRTHRDPLDVSPLVLTNEPPTPRSL